MVTQQAEREMASDVVGPPLSGIDLRAAGFTYRQIAAQMGVNVATAHRRVQRELEQQRKDEPESHDDVRDVDLAKIAWLERRIMGAALDGDLEAARFVLACIRCRRQYRKDAAPVQSADTIEALTADFDKLMNQLAQRW